MGGNALAGLGVTACRLSAKDYGLVVHEVYERLTNLFGLMQVAVIPAYINKESFGDLDVLVNIHEKENCWTDLVIQEFKPTAVFKNGSVLSFGFTLPDQSVFQVDVIAAHSEDFLFSLFYFAYNDLGNLIGRLFHKMGFKFGHRGVYYVCRDELKQRVLGEILVTRDPEQALAMVGLDYTRYLQSFAELEDIFHFVAASPFFNPDIYLLDQLSHVQRIRDRKRKTYNQFLAWCDLNKDQLTHYRFLPKSYYLDQLMRYPGFRQQYDDIQAQYQQQIQIKTKFNGNLVQEISGFQGKELGKFMAWLRQSEQDFDHFVLTCDDLDSYLKKQLALYRTLG